MPDAFDMIRFPLPCPKCKQEGSERLRDLVDSNTVACRFCGNPIDLTAQDIRARLNEAVNLYKNLGPLGGIGD